MITRGLFSSLTDNWATPKRFFHQLNAVFHFTVDVCASASNHKCARYYDIATNGLAQNWDGEVVWMNPPYGRTISSWVKKASQTKGVVVGLLPSRTDPKWFQDYVLDKAVVIYLGGRLRFGDETKPAPFGSILAVWGDSGFTYEQLKEIARNPFLPQPKFVVDLGLKAA
jgi:site-specific DNA-methyltransferase (adenine-specific)